MVDAVEQDVTAGRLTGGQALVRALEVLGVEVAFGLPGVHNLAAWKGFGASPVRLVGVRHEQTAGYAADGYARATGRLGVAVTTTGPGASNVVTAVGEAWSCHSPLLVIATVYVLVNLAIDLLYAVVDPRVRREDREWRRGADNLVAQAQAAAAVAHSGRVQLIHGN